MGSTLTVVSTLATSSLTISLTSISSGDAIGVSGSFRFLVLDLDLVLDVAGRFDGAAKLGRGKGDAFGDRVHQGALFDAVLRRDRLRSELGPRLLDSGRQTAEQTAFRSLAALVPLGDDGAERRRARFHVRQQRVRWTRRAARRHEVRNRFGLVGASLFVQRPLQKARLVQQHLPLPESQDHANEEQRHQDQADAQHGGPDVAGVTGRPAVHAAAGAGLRAVRRRVTCVAVTVALAVADAAAVAVVRTGVGPDGQAGHRQALLFDAQLAVAALGSFRRQPGVDVVDAQVDERRPARNDLAIGVDEGMTQRRHRFHAEFQLLVQVRAVQHAAPHVLVLAL